MSTKLTNQQVALLMKIADPNQPVDRKRSGTAGSLLKRELIAPNPNSKSHKAFILTQAGQVALETDLSSHKSANAVQLTPTQFLKLKAVAQPERYIDESFNHTEAGATLLTHSLIAQNPDQTSHKAYILTDQGRQILKGRF